MQLVPLHSGNEAAVMASLPLCTAYVNRLKDPLAAKQMPPGSAAAAEGTLVAIIEAVISRSSFPEDTSGGGPGIGAGCGVNFSDGDNKMTREAEQEVRIVSVRLIFAASHQNTIIQMMKLMRKAAIMVHGPYITTNLTLPPLRPRE
jgi:hypothetical protein